MCRAVPRYWMVASVCLVMITTLGVEYIRVMFHPAYQGTLYAHNPGTIKKEQIVALQDSYQKSIGEKYLHLQHYTTDSQPRKLPDSATYSLPPTGYEIEHTARRYIYDALGVKDRHLMQSNMNNDPDESVYKRTASPNKSKQQSHWSSQGAVERSHHNERPNPQEVLSPPNKVKRLYGNGTQRISHSHSVSRLSEKERRWRKIQHYHARNREGYLSNQLLKLMGVSLLPILSLSDRGFSDWYNSSRISSLLPNLHGHIGSESTLNDKVRALSLNPDIVARGDFQQEQMEKVCLQSNHSMSHLPSNPVALKNLLSHLLYDDTKRIVFCYVPKNGCSNMKRLLLVLNGILPPESAQQIRPSETLLKKAKSFRNLTSEEAVYKLRNYYKFAIVRNPLERLLSAYRNKLEHPVLYAERKHFPASLQLFIVSLFRPKYVHTWLESQTEDRHVLFPSFKEFVNYMSIFSLQDYNEHFIPFSELCHPCAIGYDLYANFKTMDYDIEAVLEYLSIPSSYYPSVASHHHTKELMNDYYRLITWREKKALFNTFQNDLDLYYALYPEETNTHKQLLEI